MKINYFLLFAYAAGSALQYDVGSIYSYEYRANVIAGGEDSQSSISSPANSTVRGSFKFRVLSKNDTHFRLVCNVFNAVITYDDQDIISPGQCTQPCPGPPGFDDDLALLCCGDTQLGDDVVVIQSVYGEVGEIYTNSDDSPYFLNIKLGAINAMDTYTYGTHSIRTSRDIVGVHTTQYVTSENASVVTKKFSEKDVSEWTDPSINSKTLSFTSSGRATLSETGIIHEMFFQHTATMLSFSAAPPSVGAESASPTESGLSQNIMARGHVLLAFAAHESSLSIKNGDKLLTQSPSYLHSSLSHAARVINRLQHKARKNRTPFSFVARANDQFAAGNNFPFNKSHSTTKSIGGAVVGASFASDFFAGTNFNCHQQTFNYKASATARANVTLFGFEASAFYAEAQYGRTSGLPLDNVLRLDVFGKNVYRKNLSAMDCSPHTYTLAHKEPGFSVDHTLWVGPIPVTFTASSDLDLTVTWGWGACDTDLSANIWIRPSATLTFSGTASLDLLVIKATTELSGSFNTALQPKLEVAGSECSVGMQVDLDRNPPDAASWKAYYEKRRCKFLMFDCHLEEAGTKTFWSWNEPAENEVLFNETIAIKR